MNFAQKLDIKNLNEFLITLGSNVLDNIFKEPSAVLAIYRELDILAQNIILRLIFVPQPVPQSVVNSWVKAHLLQHHLNAIEVLSSLNIILSPPNVAYISWTLNKSFRASLNNYILRGATVLIPKSNLPPDKHARTVEALEKYASERWECVLHYMVGGQDKKEAVSKDTKDLLLASGLMQNSGDYSEEATITKEGFQFLLLDTNSQIWYFLLYHFELLKNRPEELVESLKFLLQLNFSVVGQDYPSACLTPALEKLLQNLRELGIVYQRKRSDGRFYPTPLAVSLIASCKNNTSNLNSPNTIIDNNKIQGNTQTKDSNLNMLDAANSSSSMLNNQEKRIGHIIVETNFKIYAYSDSDLQIQLLALFCDVQYRFPKFCIGVITRESVRQALKCGITANQIIHYLKVHAHPVTLKHANPVPMNVCDQIMLWELEKCRLKFTESYLYNQFSTRTDFDTVFVYAQEAGALEWSNRNKRVMIVNKDAHDDVKKFWKSQKNSFSDP